MGGGGRYKTRLKILAERWCTHTISVQNALFECHAHPKPLLRTPILGLEELLALLLGDGVSLALGVSLVFGNGLAAEFAKRERERTTVRC